MAVPNIGTGIRLLFSEQEIAQRVDAMAEEAARFLNPEVLCVALLRGSFVFAADFIRALSRYGVMPRVDFLTLSSYGDATVSSGHIQVTADVRETVEGRHILLLDDILESGQSLTFAADLLHARGAVDVRSIVLLEKPGKCVTGFATDLVGFVIPDHFVVGYGLDYAGQYRELPFIGIMERF